MRSVPSRLGRVPACVLYAWRKISRVSPLSVLFSQAVQIHRDLHPTVHWIEQTGVTGIARRGNSPLDSHCQTVQPQVNDPYLKRAVQQ